jgi:glycerol-3-phosphate dehydrogenase (NAD(P)+)
VLDRIANERGIDMPLVDAVASLLAGKVGLEELLGTMLSRPPGDEED